MGNSCNIGFRNCFYKCIIYFLICSFIQIAISSSLYAKGSSKKYDELIKSRNKDISTLDKKLKAINQEKKALKNKQNQQVKLLNKLNSEIDITGKIIRKLSDNKQGLERDIKSNQDAISEEQHHYQELLKRVNIIMKNLYITQKEKNMQLLINYKDFDKIEHGIVYNQYFYKKGVILLDSLKQLEIGLTQKGDELSSQLSEVDSIQNNTIERKKNLDKSKKERENLVTKLKNNQKALDMEFRDIENEKKSIEIILKSLERQRKESLKKGKKQRIIKKEDLIMPAQGKIVRKFGKYLDPKYKVTLLNKGIDIKVGTNKNIVASAEGYVAKVGYFRNLKNYIIIEHSKGIYTFYSKLEHINVLEGDKVKRKTVIGNMKGSKTSEFHFEVRQGKTAVDPLIHIKR